MTLDDVLKAIRFDSRLVEYNIAAGIITREEYEAYLKSLPDDANNAISFKMENLDDTDISHH